MKRRIHILLVSVASLCAVACATAPRAPAASLADAGVKATTAFSSEVRATASQLAYVNTLDAFSTTWLACQGSAADACAPRIPSEALSEARSGLSSAIAARAEALDALRGAYEALGREAAYDGRGDLQGAADRLVAGVNQYVTAINAVSGAAPVAQVITEPIAGAVRMIAGAIGESQQRRRILSASRQISAATRTLRAALQAEAHVFNTNANYMIDWRTDARLALIQSGLVSRSTALTPLAEHLDTEIVSDAEQVIGASHPLQMAVEATVRSMSAAEVLAVQQRYSMSIEALGALITAHEQLEAGQGVSLADIVRLAGQLGALAAPSPSNQPTG